MSLNNHKIILIILLLVFVLTSLTACDLSKESDEIKKTYLTINTNNSYGIKNLKPGEGRFIYEKGSIAKIEFDYLDSYNFNGWVGKDANKIIKKEKNKYITKMKKDIKVTADLELINFKPLKINFEGIEPFNYSINNEITNVPHDLESVSIEFNNALHKDNELNVSIVPDDNTDNTDQIENEKITINKNYINITLSDWRDRFYSDDEEDNYLEFAKTYTLNIETNNKNNIFDVKNREIDRNISIDFTVEEPYPEKPENANLAIDDNKIIISWLRSKTNAKIDVNEYVEKYIIYKSKTEKYLKNKESIDKNNVKKIEIDFSDSDINYTQGDQIIRYEDQEINLSEKEYYYRIKAVNSYSNDSKLSNFISSTNG